MSNEINFKFHQFDKNKLFPYDTALEKFHNVCHVDLFFLAGLNHWCWLEMYASFTD